MGKSARIVYMGTPEFAVAPLQALIESNHEVVAVVTVPDRQAGRGRKPTPSAVKVAAAEASIPVLQPEKLRDPEFLSQLEALKADLFVVVAFRMLPEVVWKMPPLGTFNLHASLLPNYRGAAPIHRAVMNGEKETGVTTFLIDEKIDTGNILLQEQTSIDANETTGSLYQRLMNLGAPLVVQTVDGLLEGSISPREQSNKDSTTEAPKLFREDQYLDIRKPAESLHNQTRGLTPFPSALLTFTLNGDKFDTKVSGSSWNPESIGEQGVLKWTDQTLQIQTGKGTLMLTEIQWPGKRKMSIRDFKNGFQDYGALQVS